MKIEETKMLTSEATARRKLSKKRGLRRGLGRLGAIAAACFLGTSAFAGTYKHITIDGSFEDWAGVPLAYTQEQDVFNVVAYKDLYIANDEDYIYFRFTIYGPATNAFTSLQNYFFNGDNDNLTGYSAHGTGSELLIQGGNGYQQLHGGFNEGSIANLDWAGLPLTPATEFEFRVSRNATFATTNAPIFSTDGFTVTLESETPSFTPTEWYPPSGGGVAYTFESAPPDLTTNLQLVGLSSSSWQVNASGTDLGTDWLGQAYDDSQSPWSPGLGLFGYTTTPGAYPTIQTPLASGANSYYFRTHFNWEFNAANVAFVVTNYLSDGAVFYLNGAEVKRVRIPAGSVNYATAASGENPSVGSVEVLKFSGGPLVAGDNILEVETHQAAGSAADMVFGMSLTAAAQFPVTILDTNLPADLSLIGGDTATFSADVLGSGPLSYQWLKNGTNLPNATNLVLTIPSILMGDAGTYALTIANAVSTNTTRAATLTVLGTPVTITDVTRPADQVIVAGHPVTFSVFAAGSAPLSYQWYVGNTPILDATNATYSIASVSVTNAGNYYAVVTNTVSSTNSRTAVLTVLPDTIAPAVTNLTASANRIVVIFSEPLNANTATNPANYSVSGGATVTNVTINGQTVTLNLDAPLSLGTSYLLTINGVQDVYGNAAHATVPAVPTISIDGSFADWNGIAPIYSGPPGADLAADFKDIYMYNDENFYYFRVTLWHDIDPTDGSGCFPRRANLHFDTDGIPNTGYHPAPSLPGFGAELLQQTSTQYQEKDGNFNDGVPPVGLNYLMAPTVRPPVYPADFEWRYSRKATFGGGGLIFSTNTVGLYFQGQDRNFVPWNVAPMADGSLIIYTNVEPVAVQPLPLGQLAVNRLSNGRVALVWDQPGALQAGDASSGGTWTNVPSATSPYVIPASAGQQFFRLAK